MVVEKVKMIFEMVRHHHTIYHAHQGTIIYIEINICVAKPSFPLALPGRCGWEERRCTRVQKSINCQLTREQMPRARSETVEHRPSHGIQKAGSVFGTC